MKHLAKTTIAKTALAMTAALGLFVVGSLARAEPAAGEAQPAATPESVMINPSFEGGSAEQPADWATHTWQGKAAFEWDAHAGRTGKRCVSVNADHGGDAAWFTQIPVRPNATYRLSGWIKTENVEPGTGLGALLNLHNMQRIKTQAVTGTRDWTRVEVVFETNQHDSIQVNCLLGGWGTSTGKAWYDDLQLERLSAKALEPGVTIDVTKKGEPVSKYIYGQFIEHLGRCIYGGIWAEMLDDRKFYEPVGRELSPWKAIGGKNVENNVENLVEMVVDDSFVGDHTPQINFPADGARAGIAQEGLGLVQDKTYVGRIWLAGDPDAGPVEVAIEWGEDPECRQAVTIEKLSKKYMKTSLEFTPTESTDNGRLEITAAGGGSFRVGTVSLMPADNVHGMRADTLELLRQLDSPVYRWPGGNFVSGYDWTDGIGDVDRRPPRKNPAWKGIEHNDFGIDEFMRFCKLIDTEPLVVVNTGAGQLDMALAELEYANGAANGTAASSGGRLRAKNGHAEPYGVKWWGIGNEMYGGWQIGHMPLEDYIKKHNAFVEAMRAQDPSIQVVAVGAHGPWSEGMMQHSAEHMDLVSEHFYCREKPGLIAHVAQIPERVRIKTDAHRRYRREFDSLAGKDIRIALDEWNYWYGEHLYGELGTRYFLKDALGIAAGLHEMVRQSDLFFMANYAQTVNVIGAIKTNKTAAAFATTGLVLKLYRERFGTLPVAVQSNPPWDVAAALTADGKLTVGIVNPTLEKVEIPLELLGARPTGTGQLWQIAGTDPMAHNNPGQKPQVVIEQKPADKIANCLPVAPCSVSIYVLELE